MSIFKYLNESLCSEADEDQLTLGGDELGAEDTPEDIPEETPEDKGSDQGDPKALVNSLIKYAPGKSKEIKNMLKYAANSAETYDIFDSALDYFESIEDTLKDANDEAIPDEEPAEDVPVDDKVSKDDIDLSF